MSKFVPIIVGVGDCVNRSVEIKDAREPADLILNAIENALRDTGLGDQDLSKLQEKIDGVSIVRTWTWPYDDLPGLLSSKLRVTPKHKEYTDHGGDKPAKLFDQAARRIAKGENKIALVAGGEALASLTAFAKAKKLPPPGWTTTDASVDSVFSPTTARDRETADNLGGLGKSHEIGVPVQIYPLFENGFRAHTGLSIKENHSESTQLYASFDKVASENEYGWNYGRDSSSSLDRIGKVDDKNRMICFPYPLVMNAFNTVNLAGACLLTSTKVAEEIGVPKEKWIYPLGGAGTTDSNDFWERPNFHSSPAIERSVDTALQVSGLTKHDIDCYDVYSCFPIVPKVFCRHLGLSITNPEKPITLLGGLTSFGGAGNNYSMHAITAMTRELRTGKYKNGLILANGGVMTYQYALCLSRNPRQDDSDFPTTDILPKMITDVEVPKVDETADGEAYIETYTVEFDRKNNPWKGHIVGRLKSNNHRFLANHGDDSTLQQLASWTKEPIGRTGTVRPDNDRKGRNLFFLDGGSKL